MEENNIDMETNAEDNLGGSKHESSNRLDLNIEQDCSSPRDAACVVTDHKVIQLTEEEEELIRSLDVGMEFDSDEHAYKFYVKYADLVGFRVRKDWANRSKVHGQVLTRKFTCSNEGKRKRDRRDNRVRRHRKETRTGCLAHLVIHRQPNGKYQVIHFEPKHNHEYVGPVIPRRKKSRAAVIVEKETGNDSDHSDSQPMLDSSGLQAMCKREMNQRILDWEDYNFHDLEEGNDNHLSSGRTREMGMGEAGQIFRYLHRRQFENPSFIYKVHFDSDDKISNIFWTDDDMAFDYGHFGDVICFDTLYRTSFNFRPFVQLVGLNHHRQPVVFAAALLYDESVESLTWLFRSFLEAMSGNKPKLIVTDQDAVIIEAVNSVFPEAKHSVCIWQMVENALNNLSHMIQEADSFAIDFRRCIYDFRDEEEFIRAWDAMGKKYGLEKNEWLKWMFREREKWSPVYGCNFFFIDLEGKHVIENLSVSLKDFLRSEVNVFEFFKHFRRTVKAQRHKEVEASIGMEKCLPKLMGNIFLLKHPSETYTPKAFEMFQREYEKSLDVVVNLLSEKEYVCEYKTNVFGQARDFTVLLNLSDNTINCSCMMFQQVGMLCSHCLKVLDTKNIKAVPLKYILKRWSRDAKTENPKKSSEDIEDGDAKVVAVKRYKDIFRRIVKLSAQAASSEEAFKFAESKLGEVLNGVERILNPEIFKKNQLVSSSSNATNLSEAENFNMFQSRAQLENLRADGEQLDEMQENAHECDDVPFDGAMNFFRERSLDASRNCNVQPPCQEILNISCSVSTDDVSPHTRPPSVPSSENLFGYEVSGVPPMYQSSSLMAQPQANSNICPSPNFFPVSPAQMLQEPFLQTAIMNHGQVREGMNFGVTHPQSSSFLHYDQRYRTSSDSQCFGMR